MRIFSISLLVFALIGCVSQSSDSEFDDLTRSLEIFAQESKERDNAIISFLEEESAKVSSVQRNILHLEGKLKSVNNKADSIRRIVDLLIARTGQVETELVDLDGTVREEFDQIKERLSRISDIPNEIDELMEVLGYLSATIQEIKTITQEIQSRENWIPKTFLEQWERK